MSNKRGADNYLTLENMDNSEEENVSQNAEEFNKAPDSVMKTRRIKKAHRKVASDAASTGSVNPFQSFSFNTNNNSPAKANSFNLQADASVSTSSSTNFSAFSFANSTPEAPPFSSSISKAASSAASTKSTSTMQYTSTASKILSTLNKPHLSNTVTFSKKQRTNHSESSLLDENMANLNEEVLQWIQEHLKATPDCILTPIFDDYNRYVKELDPCPKEEAEQEIMREKKGEVKSEGAECSVEGGVFEDDLERSTGAEENKGVFAFNPPSTSSTNAPFSFASISKSTTEDTKATPFLFGSKTSGQSSLFGSTSFGATGNTTVSSSGNIFQQGFFNKPLQSTSASAATTATTEEEGEYVPPKVESVESKEEGAFYSVKCKLYYKIEDKYSDRGVGFLHLKPNNLKTQLLVRTDTTLGNILLNINLDKSLPVARQGANNVTLVCVPNPPIDPKQPSTSPLCVLIRVKGKVDADALYKQLTDCQESI